MHFADCIFFLLKLESTVEKKATYFVWGKECKTHQNNLKYFVVYIWQINF